MQPPPNEIGCADSPRPHPNQNYQLNHPLLPPPNKKKS